MPAESLQNSLSHWAVSEFPSWTEPLARLFSHLGSEYFYLLLLPLLFWFGPWTTGQTAARAVVLSDLLGEWIKWTLNWPRPSVALIQESSPGFVSTHAALSMATAVSVWRQWPKARPLLALWVLGVGWSRLRLGVHFPLDIAGGWALGLLVGVSLLRLRVDTRRTLYLVVSSALLVALLWPGLGDASWQRDLGLLLGLELGVVLLLRHGFQRPAPLGFLAGMGRLIVLVCAYVGLKALAWPVLVRYFLLGTLVSVRRVPKPLT